MSRTMYAPPRSRFTADGRFWWDGYGWVATQAAGGTRRSGFMSRFSGPHGVGKARLICAGIACVLAIVILGVFLSGVFASVGSSVHILPASSSSLGHSGPVPVP